MIGGEVDPLLVDLIGPAAARALREHAGWKECDYDLELVFDSGRSSAAVAMVLEVDRLVERSTKLVLKTVGTAEEPIAVGEFARHRRAVEKAPEDFGKVHLSALWKDPIRVGDGTWIVLQELVGDGDREVEPLAVLLDHALGRAPVGPPRRPAVDIDADGFARACGEVVEVISVCTRSNSATTRSVTTHDMIHYGVCECRCSTKPGPPAGAVAR